MAKRRFGLVNKIFDKIRIGSAGKIDMDDEWARFGAVSKELTDDETAVFDVPDGVSRHICFMVSNISAGDAFVGAGGTNALSTIHAGSNVDNGGTVNNDTDTKVNIWASGSGEVSVKNRRGSTLRFTIYFMAT